VDDYISIQNLVGGNFDCVRTDLGKPDEVAIVGYVNDMGLVINLELNYLATALFGREIRGDAVVTWGLSPNGYYDGDNHDMPNWISCFIKTDLLMQTASISRNFRLEARSAFTQCGVPEFQIGQLSNATLLVGDNYTYTPRPFVVGTQSTANTTPSNTLAVHGTLACSGRMTGKMFPCAGKVNADGTKTFTSSSGLTDFTCSVSSNVYQTRFNSSHTSANYVIQITG
jgi:hypothetical protein